MTPKRPDLRSQSGFSMFLALMAMFVTAMFIAAAFAAANGDLPVSGDSKDRKITYAAAEAGLNFYLNHLQQDNDYWTMCDQVPAPNAAEVNPVNQQWDGIGTDTRRWRTIPGSASQYTIEILHTADYDRCETDPNKQASVIDAATRDRRVVPPQGLPELHLLHRLRDARSAGAVDRLRAQHRADQLR
jgi:hypothetical protein